MICAFLGAVVLAAAIAGCGADDEAVADRLSKPALIAAADKICEKTDQAQNAELNAYLDDNPKAQATRAGQIEMIAVAGLPAVRTEIEELAALPVPEGEEEELEAIWLGMDKALEESEQDPSRVLTATGTPFSEVDKLASNYGFKACNSAL